ncbi:hypothetical protein RRG08_041545 [Elysia crispata]|uniref:Uncharacterized protein n=1 Tax=Elysia crispata TaxID=231223 RepID=A0AAE1DMG2_9GAST|nr:hypothetical protein RRG08_041545 [Elysia crispata]
MKTFSIRLLTLLLWPAAVAWAEDCSEVCHVSCVFPGDACKLISLRFQKPCLEDFDFCVLTCTKRCECTRHCKERTASEGRLEGGFDSCEKKCFTEAMKNVTPTKTKKSKKAKKKRMMLKSFPGLLLSGEQGHLG